MMITGPNDMSGVWVLCEFFFFFFSKNCILILTM